MLAFRTLATRHLRCLGRHVARRNYVIQHPFVGISDNDRLRQMIEEKGRPDLVSQLRKLADDLSELAELQKTADNDDEMMGAADAEFKEVTLQLEAIQKSIVEEIVHDQDNFVNSLILEINCGVGGQEAMLFAGELLNVYENYINWKGWTSSVLSLNETDLGGINSATIQVDGRSCYKFMRHEAGVHRVQRTPKTEKSGRIHTSTATVNVIPIRGNELEVIIDAKDLKFDTKRSSGAGGQHVNKTESCAIVTHIPTGLVVECQEERNQVVNRERALKKLRTLLLLKKKDMLAAEQDQTRKKQVSSADRSEKVRTYQFVQDRITDHRLSDNVYGVKDFMDCSRKPEKLEAIIAMLDERHKKEVLNSLLNGNKS